MRMGSTRRRWRGAVACFQKYLCGGSGVKAAARGNEPAAVLYRGTVMHARLKPVGHRFTYQEWMTRDIADALVAHGHAAGGATAPSRQASACAGGMADQYLVYTSL